MDFLVNASSGVGDLACLFTAGFATGRSGGLSTIVGRLPERVALAGSGGGETSFLTAGVVVDFFDVGIMGLGFGALLDLETAMPSLSLS